MMKTALMTAALAAVFLLGTACFGLFGRSEPGGDAAHPECAGLSGQARVDCEQQHRDE